MNMTSDFKRRVHIEGQPNNPTGHLVRITDADTGEAITGVKSVVVYLDSKLINHVEIDYYKYDENNKLVVQEDGEPIQDTAILGGEDVSLNITAVEFFPSEETPHE